MHYQYDSRKIAPGDTFICLPGGEAYIEDARSRGAAHVVSMNRGQMAKLAMEVYGNPSKDLTVIGVTGTNGKTTVTYILKQCLEAAGYQPAVLGTINSPLTTPESLDIQALMADHLKNGGTHFIMEVSSHGIHQGRVLGIQFDIKVLTNITHDHLDYHGSFEAYKATKLQFMKEWPGSSIYPEDYEKVQLPAPIPLLGKFNLANAKAAWAVLTALKIPEKTLTATFPNLKAPPGRFEWVNPGDPIKGIVDYAHTPDGLENVLQTARELAIETNGRLITVFGCGGDRDRTKRPKMAEVAARFSDSVIITMDNPRTENPDQILEDILKGIPKGFSRYEVIPDRAAAIRHAVKLAVPGDIVMMAGKGHENYQLLNTGRIHFDDCEVARAAFAERRSH